jgi:hypothetical protein
MLFDYFSWGNNRAASCPDHKPAYAAADDLLRKNFGQTLPAPIFWDT